MVRRTRSGPPAHHRRRTRRCPITPALAADRCPAPSRRRQRRLRHQGQRRCLTPPTLPGGTSGSSSSVPETRSWSPHRPGCPPPECDVRWPDHVRHGHPVRRSSIDVGAVLGTAGGASTPHPLPALGRRRIRRAVQPYADNLRPRRARQRRLSSPNRVPPSALSPQVRHLCGHGARAAVRALPRWQLALLRGDLLRQPASWAKRRTDAFRAAVSHRPYLPYERPMPYR